MIRRATPVCVVVLAMLSACADEGGSPTSPRAGEPSHAYTAPAVPADGEFIRQVGTTTVHLSYGGVLYGVPDMQTLRACTGGRETVVREVSSLPGWTRRTLPSAGIPERRPHGNVWMHGDRPVKTSTSGTVYAVVGCVKSGIPSEATYNAMFNGDWSRIVTVDAAALDALPTGPTAQPVPLRRAATLVESGGTYRWITFHGGSLGIPDPTTMDSYCRPWSDKVTSTTEYNTYAQVGILQPAGSGCQRGDDYPYKNHPNANYTSSGADPWQFYHRECTSFVAWRLNQDGIEFHNYYGGPRWSNADLWDNVAASLQANNPGLGVRVNKTPARGAVAQWNWMHVAYVSAVHNDGTITIEEYNYPSGGLFGTRRISAAAVDNYIHFR